MLFVVFYFNFAFLRLNEFVFLNYIHIYYFIVIIYQKN